MLRIRSLGRRPYTEVWTKMSEFTSKRNEHHEDELWFVEHEAVYTQGQAGKAEHIRDLGGTPLVASDRGGQVTYHGPGQLVIYPLLNLRRLSIGVRDLVTMIEQSVISLLAHYDVEACARADAPGVYIRNKKIASLGLRVRRGCSFHGVALNVNMDLSPFLRINPCGYQGMEMTKLCDEMGDKVSPSLTEVQKVYIDIFVNAFGYNTLTHSE